MNEKEALELLDTPDVLLDFDPFLVGEGNVGKYQDYLNGRKFQLSGMDSFKDLIEPKKDSTLIMEDDLKRIEHSLVNAETALEIFYQYKKRAYDLMKFTRFKSATFSGPVRERDLVLSKDDAYLVKYLVDGSYTENALKNLAQLSAWEDMEIYTVKVSRSCDCPMCYCLEGIIKNTLDLRKIILSQSDVYSCEYKIDPVIESRSSMPFCTTENTISGLTHYTNLPLDLRNEILSLDIPVEDIEFIDMRKISDYSTALVFSGHFLLVHDSYIGNKSPADFIKEWLKDEESFEYEESDEVFYYQGREVTVVSNGYRDVHTGEILK